MNGCDHQPVQADLGKAIEVASELYPDINFKHSNFPDYIKAIKEKVPMIWRLSKANLQVRTQTVGQRLLIVRHHTFT